MSYPASVQMPRGPITVEPVGFAVGAIPDIKVTDVRLLSAWTTIASILALTALWRLVHTCFEFAVLARSPKLGRLKSSESRSPRVLAGHFTAVANAVVCMAAFLTAAQARLAAAGWSPGALIPLWSRPLSIGPPLPGTSLFYLSLAAYCLHASFVAAERATCDVATECMVLLQLVLLFLLASSACMVEFVPELALTFLLLEVPSPLVALFHALRDFGLHLEPTFRVTGFLAVVVSIKLRLLACGFCLACAMLHPDAWGKLDGPRLFILSLCVALVATYGVQAARLFHDFRHDLEAAKDP